MALAPLKIVIAGVDKYSKTLMDANDKFKKVGGIMTSIGKKMSIGLTAPITLAGVASLKVAGDFQESMNRVAALTQAPQDQLKQMSDLARDLGATTRFSAKQAADAMGFLGMAGWKTNDILKATPDLLNLSAASGTELARVADITSNIMGAFRIEASKTGQVSDILASAISSSNVDMEMLAETMKDAAPIADQFGASLKDTATLAGFLGNIGIQGTKAGTAMKNIFLTLSAPDKKAREIFKKLNVDLKNSKGGMRDVSAVFADLGKKLSTMSDADRLRAISDVFGNIPIASAAALAKDLGSADSQFMKLAKTMDNFDDRAKKMADLMNKGLNPAIDELMSALTELAISFGESGIMDFITSMVNKLSGLVREFAKINTKILKFLAVMGSFVAFIGPIVLGIGSFITILSKLGLSLTAAGGALALLTGPIGITIMSIIAIGAAIGGIVAYWDELKVVAQISITKISNLINKLQNRFPTLFKVINAAIGGIKLAFENWLLIGQLLFKGLWEGLKGIFNLLKWSLTPAFEGLKNILLFSLDSLEKVLSLASKGTFIGEILDFFGGKNNNEMDLNKTINTNLMNNIKERENIKSQTKIELDVKGNVDVKPKIIKAEKNVELKVKRGLSMDQVG